MIYGEKTRREMDGDGKGLTGTQVFMCDWGDVDSTAVIEGLPVQGSPWIDWFGVPNPFLRCVHRNAKQMEENPNLGIYTAQFSTEGQTAEDYYESNSEISLEPGPEITGYKYESTGTPAVGVVAPPIPVNIVTVKMRRDAPPYLAVMGAAGKINDQEFLTYPEGCCMFLGASADNSYDGEGHVVSSGVVYKFSVKDREQKYFYRPPVQARDRYGNLLYWHNDPREPNFCLPNPATDETVDPDTGLPKHSGDFATVITRDDPKPFTPVWANQVPGQLSAPEGKGGWDPVQDPDGNPFFTAVDLGAVLEIPELA